MTLVCRLWPFYIPRFRLCASLLAHYMKYAVPICTAVQLRRGQSRESVLPLGGLGTVMHAL